MYDMSVSSTLGKMISVRLGAEQSAMLDAEAARTGRSLSEVLRSRAFERSGDSPVRQLLGELAARGVTLPKRLTERVDRLTGLALQRQAAQDGRHAIRDDIAERLASGDIDAATARSELAAAAVTDELDEVLRRASRLLEAEVRDQLRRDGAAIAAAITSSATAAVNALVRAGRACSGYAELLAALRSALPVARQGNIGWGAVDESRNGPNNRLSAALGAFRASTAQDLNWLPAVAALDRVKAYEPLVRLLGAVCGQRATWFPADTDRAAMTLVGRAPEPLQLAAADDLGVQPGWYVSPVVKPS
jgi:hypothetical protein